MKFLQLYLFGIVFIAGFILFGYMHELVHVKINSDYNIKSRIEIQFPDFITIGEGTCPNNTCLLAHEINEAVSYPLMVFYAVFGIAMYIIIWEIIKQ